jgi:hypothetical protein
LLSSHCWVEVGGKGEPGRWVIDFTGDQVEPLRNYEMLCWPHDELRERLGLEYTAHHLRLAPSEVSGDAVQTRLTTLKKRLQQQR